MNPIDIFFMVALFGVFYFLILRPQAQEREAHEALMKSLAPSDEVVTSSGIHGKVLEVREDVVVLEIATKAAITLDKSAVARRRGTPAKA